MVMSPWHSYGQRQQCACGFSRHAAECGIRRLPQNLLLATEKRRIAHFSNCPFFYMYI